MSEPARTLRDVHRATNPGIPLQSDDPRYVSCVEVRGNEDVVTHLLNNITWEEDGVYNHQLFTGHRGCGKSTELFRLKARLEDAGYAVIYFAGSDDLNLDDVKYSDIILAIARRVTDHLAQQEIELDEEILERVLNWFGETLSEKSTWRDVRRTLEAEVELGAGVPDKLPLIARLLARVTGQIQSGEEIKDTIRLKLDPQIKQLVQHTNALLEAASDKLNRPLVIMVDNLDRITLMERSSGRTNHDEIYIDHGEQLRGLAAHIVYTIPISMIYSALAPLLTAIFPDKVVLPMIKSHTREGEPAEAGMQVLREILGQRIALDEIFATGAVDYLCQMCGGHPRDLMVLVRYAVRYAQNRWPQPIDRDAVERAVGSLVTDYLRAVPDEHYDPLARVHLTKEISSDAAHRLMLHNHSVLEYYNGQPPWHDVHPVVLELPKFKTALAALEKEEQANLGLLTA